MISSSVGSDTSADNERRQASINAGRFLIGMTIETELLNDLPLPSRID